MKNDSSKNIDHCNVYVVIPVYNENDVIGGVLDEVEMAGFKNIIIIDDGSDNEIILNNRKTNIILLRHAINRGKGAAVKTGIEMAKKMSAEIVVTTDGDGQHDPDDIKKMIEFLKDGFDVILGSRFIEKKSKNIPFIRIIFNYIGNFLTWLIYGLWVSDSQSGLRVYSKRAINLIDTRTDRYEYDSEIIREVARNKLKYKEVAISVRYTDYSIKKQNKQNFKNGIRTLFKMFLYS